MIFLLPSTLRFLLSSLSCWSWLVNGQWEFCQSIVHSPYPQFLFRTEWRGLRKGKFSMQRSFVFLMQINAWKNRRNNWKTRGLAVTFFRKHLKQRDGNVQPRGFSCRFIFFFFFFNKIKVRWIVSSFSFFRTHSLFY